MKLRFLWPGKTRQAPYREIIAENVKRLGGLIPCEILETAEARGVDERFKDRILDIEARGLEKHFKDDYIVCLIDEGRDMSSGEFARFFERRAAGPHKSVTFVVGGFLGLAQRIVDRADLRMSVSKMTFSHELCRIMLMEQIYRSMSILKGRAYAK